MARPRPWASPRRWQLTGGLIVTAALLLVGCGSGTPTYSTFTSPSAATPLAETTPTQTTTASSPYPIVPFEADAGGTPELGAEWIYTIQVASITKNPEGFAGAGSEPDGWTWLMVRYNVINENPQRTPPTPELKQFLTCSGSGSKSWNPTSSGNSSALYGGYELEPDSTQLTLATETSLGYEVPQLYGAEWQVPEATNTSQVTCSLTMGTPEGRPDPVVLTNIQ